jgi:hypothetical protein
VDNESKKCPQSLIVGKGLSSVIDQGLGRASYPNYDSRSMIICNIQWGLGPRATSYCHEHRQSSHGAVHICNRKYTIDH